MVDSHGWPSATVNSSIMGIYHFPVIDLKTELENSANGKLQAPFVDVDQMLRPVLYGKHLPPLSAPKNTTLSKRIHVDFSVYM